MLKLKEMESQVQQIVEDFEWNGNWEKSNGYNFNIIVQEALNKGLISEKIDESSFIVARKLANKLILNSTKVVNIGNLERYINNGIQSGCKRMNSLRVTELATGHENNVHLTIGIPYIFNTYRPRVGNTPKRNFIVVLNGMEIMDRDDLDIPFIDSGILYKEYNPFSEWIRTTIKKHPEYAKTELDPTYVLYSFIMHDSKLLSSFKEYMKPIYRKFCLSKDDLHVYMTMLLASFFPFPGKESRCKINESRGFMPEGNVKNEIKKIILHHEDYVEARKKYTNHADILVDAGAIQNSRNDKILLKKYVELIDAEEEFSRYISLFNRNLSNKNRERL